MFHFLKSGGFTCTGGWKLHSLFHASQRGSVNPAGKKAEETLGCFSKGWLDSPGTVGNTGGQDPAGTPGSQYGPGPAPRVGPVCQGPYLSSLRWQSPGQPGSTGGTYGGRTEWLLRALAHAWPWRRLCCSCCSGGGGACIPLSLGAAAAPHPPKRSVGAATPTSCLHGILTFALRDFYELVEWYNSTRLLSVISFAFKGKMS